MGLDGTNERAAIQNRNVQMNKGLSASRLQTYHYDNPAVLRSFISYESYESYVNVQSTMAGIMRVAF